MPGSWGKDSGAVGTVQLKFRRVGRSGGDVVVFAALKHLGFVILNWCHKAFGAKMKFRRNSIPEWLRSGDFTLMAAVARDSSLLASPSQIIAMKALPTP